MARYGLPADKAFGVPVATMRQLAQRIGPNHELAAALWKSGWYEARMVAVFIEDPAQVTAAQLDSGVVTSKTGGSAIPPAFTCSTSCRTQLARSSHGAAGAESFRSVAPLRCLPVSRCTARISMKLGSSARYP